MKTLNLQKEKMARVANSESIPRAFTEKLFTARPASRLGDFLACYCIGADAMEPHLRRGALTVALWRFWVLLSPRKNMASVADASRVIAELKLFFSPL